MRSENGTSHATEEEQGRRIKAILLKDQTLVIRNEIAIRLDRFGEVATEAGINVFPILKIIVPAEYAITVMRNGYQRPMSTYYADGLGIAKVSLPEARRRVDIADYGIDVGLENTPEGRGASIIVSSPRALPNFILEDIVPSRRIRAHLIREKAQLRPR